MCLSTAVCDPPHNDGKWVAIHLGDVGRIARLHGYCVYAEKGLKTPKFGAEWSDLRFRGIPTPSCLKLLNREG